MTKKIKQIISFIALIVLLGGGFWYFKSRQENSQKIAQKAVDYLNNELLPEELTASLIKVKEKENVVELKFKIKEQEYTSYVSKNGELFFLEGVELENSSVDKTEDENESKNEENNQSGSKNQAQEEGEVSKKDKPEVDLFVMSYCPYGNEAENTMKPVYDLLKDDVDFSVHYIVSAEGDKIQSLHGQKEVDQNMREVCVMNKFGMDEFWDFTTYVNNNCGSNGSCWKEAANKIGVSSQEIESCVQEEGLAYMKEDAKISNQEGASGSPTLVLNGTKMDPRDSVAYEYDSAIYSYGKPESYKEAICSVFTQETQPESCSETLSDLDSSASGGSCQ